MLMEWREKTLLVTLNHGVWCTHSKRLTLINVSIKSDAEDRMKQWKKNNKDQRKRYKQYGIENIQTMGSSANNVEIGNWIVYVCEKVDNFLLSVCYVPVWVIKRNFELNWIGPVVRYSIWYLDRIPFWIELITCSNILLQCARWLRAFEFSTIAL